MTTALLVLDAQNNMFAPDLVFERDKLLQTLKDLTTRARESQTPVVFTRYDGHPDLTSARGSEGWELHPALDPHLAAAIVDKSTPNPFLRTGLASWLVQNGITRLVICGLLTEYCVDTAVRAAHGLGYPVILVADGHSTKDGAQISAAGIIAHHNAVLTSFAEVLPAAEVVFDLPLLPVAIDRLTPGDVAAVQAGLAEWQVYDRWLSRGDATPYWPHTHPARVADTLHQLWDPEFRLRNRYTDPPPWEMGMAHTFIQPLMDTPMFICKAAVQAVTKAFDHLLQNPRNPLSPHINQLGDHLYSYDARDIRLIYVPQVTIDANGRERRYIFLLWAAPGVPERNPFAL